MFLRNDETLTD